MTWNTRPDLSAPDDPASLHKEITRLNKVIQALIKRAEQDLSSKGSDFGLFQTAIVLEDQVRVRTGELEAALRENERIKRDLLATKDRMAREIEERRQAQEELELEREEQRFLIERLEKAMAQLVQAEKLASLGSLVAGVAHELNTPLGNSMTVATTLNEVIGEFNGQIESGGLKKSSLMRFIDQCRDAAQLMEKNCRRAADLIGSFKQVAVDQTSMRRRSFDLREVLDETLVALQPVFKHTQHQLELSVPAGLVMDSFPGPIEQIIANLVGNSLQHGFENIAQGNIRIEAFAVADDTILLSYTDDGHGIAEADAKRAFDPFFTTKLGSGGSGLGLYIVFNLATAVLGGRVKLSTRPGQGVCFEFHLPRQAPQPPLAGENHDQ